MECEKPLRLVRGTKSSHRPFSLSRGFMRDFDSIICVDVIDVTHRGHDRAMSRIIASEFVGHQPPGFSPLAFDETAEKAFCRPPIPVALHENIKDIAVLIDRPIQIVSLSLHGDKDFVDVPRVALGGLGAF
jgi:hypothetical protein